MTTNLVLGYRQSVGLRGQVDVAVWVSAPAYGLVTVNGVKVHEMNSATAASDAEELGRLLVTALGGTATIGAW